jgi:hypothetical protein
VTLLSVPASESNEAFCEQAFTTPRLLLNIRCMLWASFVTVSLAGCADETLREGIADDSSGISDSAGIEIVEHSSLRGARRLDVDARPFLDLGGLRLDESEELDPRQPWLGAIELKSGTIVVNEFSGLKFFSREGNFIRIVASAGSGPGEFGQTREICRMRGDSMLVIDYSTGRLSLWDSVGTHVQTWNRPGFIPLGACRDDGTVIIQQRFHDRGTTSEGRRIFEHVLARPDGRVIASLGSLPGSLYAGPIISDPSIVPYRDELLIGAGDRFEVRIQTLDGRLRRIIRVKDGTLPITDEEWQKGLDDLVPRNMSRERRTEIAARVHAMKRPAAWPAFHRVRTDAKGRIWVEQYRKPTREAYSRPALWTVFDSAGALLGQLVLPWREPGAMAELVGVGSDRIIIRRRDQDGAIHLSFHRLGKGFR